MRAWLRKWWPVGKLLFTVAILVFIGRQFARDLQSEELWHRSLRPGWLILSGVLYILGLGLSALFWFHLLRITGQHPAPLAAVRAYYLGHLGKYLPGKAWALFLRSALIRGSGVRVGVAVLTSLYEVLTTMAAGALLAAVLFLLRVDDWSLTLDRQSFRELLTLSVPETTTLDPKVLAALALLVLGLVGTPLMPAFYNRLARRAALPFQEAGAPPPPRLPLTALAQGLVLTGAGWLLLGASLWAVFQGIMRDPPAWTWDILGRYSAYSALAYVAGFLIVLVPSGLGVREYFLRVFLIADLGTFFAEDEGDARLTAALAVILLRVIWTSAELVVAAVIYWLPGGAARKLGTEDQPEEGRA